MRQGGDLVAPPRGALALEDDRRKRAETQLALKEARARIAELEGEAPADPSPPSRRR